MVEVWLCAINANEGHSSYEEFKDRKVVAQGWPDTGDLSNYVGKSWDAIHSHLLVCLGEVALKEPRCRFAFKNLISNEGIKTGDLVVVYEGTKLMGICQIKPNTRYRYDAGIDDKYEYANTLTPVEWIDWSDISKDFSPNAPRLGVTGIMKSQKYSNQIYDLWRRHKG